MGVERFSILHLQGDNSLTIHKMMETLKISMKCVFYKICCV